jgi:UDP-2,3-diacylglucosamine hydrolase
VKIIFFSDAHLDKGHDYKNRLVIGFLKDVCGDADMVFILGDLFEFYHGYEGYIFPWYQDVADSLKALAAKGKTIHYVEGNHEFRLGKYFESYTGVLSSGSLSMDIDGKKMLFAHGHEIRNSCLVRALKTDFMSSVMDLFKPTLAWKAAAIAGMFLSRRKKPYNRKVIDIFRKYALVKFEEGYEAVVLAHTHIPDSIESTGPKDRKRYYLNTGDIVRDSTYVEYNTERGFELKKYHHT